MKQKLLVGTAVFALILISSLSFMKAGISHKSAVDSSEQKWHSIDSPEGRAIHQQMMQMQANQQNFQLQQEAEANIPKESKQAN